MANLLDPHWKPATGVLFFLWYPSVPVSSCPAVLCFSKVPLRRPVCFYVPSSIVESPARNLGILHPRIYRLPINSVGNSGWSRKAHPAVLLRVWRFTLSLLRHPRHAQHSFAVVSNFKARYNFLHTTCRDRMLGP
jgi:hypothetical protein